MEWTDEGIVLGVRRHGESAAIVELLTRAHGRHLGIVRGGRSRRQQPVLQPGNRVGLVWRARIEEHLGTFAVEPLVLRAGTIMSSALALQGINLIGALLRLLPERDPHPALFETVELIAENLHEPAIAPALMVRLELAVLSELGFGLDLAECAATGVSEDLIYVSPKSGRAVSGAAGEPWKDRLLSLPSFMGQREAGHLPDPQEVRAGFALTGFFLERDVFAPRNSPMPDARHAFIGEFNRLIAAVAKEG
jgi:DNA repair protein RecO (recombination protein O)